MQRDIEAMAYIGTTQGQERKEEPQLGRKNGYTTPRLVALGDIRGVTMGSTGKYPDTVSTKKPNP